MRGQSSVVILFIIILIFGMMFLFLLTFTKSPGDSEYTQLYTTNLLLSIVNTETGDTPYQTCGTIKKLLTCATTNSNYQCGGMSCDVRVEGFIKSYLSNSSGVTNKALSHMIVAETSGNEFKAGDLGIEILKVKKTVISERLSVALGGSFYTTDVRLIVVER
ncbi:MAG: hypothetical protein ABIJ92_02825 [Candidatus Aenigmatarchaeota archaeon]